MKIYSTTISKLDNDYSDGPGRDIQRLMVTERLARKWTQYKMADFLNISQSTVSRLEAGDYQGFNLCFLLDIAEQLGYEPHMVFLKK